MESRNVLLFLFMVILIFNFQSYTSASYPGNFDSTHHNYSVLCYVHGDAINKEEFRLQFAESEPCTHLLLTHANIKDETFEIYFEKSSQYDALLMLKALKLEFPRLKTMVAVGGWHEGSTKYSQMVRSEEKRKAFIKSALDLMEKYKLDGLDIDWMWPSHRGGSYSDKTGLVQLLKEMREEFDGHGYLLSVKISPISHMRQSAHALEDIAKYVNFMNIHTHDYNGPWQGATGHNAPLYSIRSEWSVDQTVTDIRNEGGPIEKLILGLPLSGRLFELRNSRSHSLGSPSTKKDVILPYNQICVKIYSPGWEIVEDEYRMVPYAYKDEEWISFDNEKSLRAKARYAMKLNMPGVYVTMLDLDDFKGSCRRGRFPLMRAINEELSSNHKSVPSEDEVQSGDEYSDKKLQVFYPSIRSDRSDATATTNSFLFVTMNLFVATVVSRY